MLIDRSAHIGLAEAALGECASGRFRLLIAEGGPGCGKSAFLREFLRVASRAGALVAEAPGLPGGRAAPLGLVRRLAAAPGLPEPVRERLRTAGDRDAGQVPGAAQELGAALCAACAPAPLVIAVDDLHHVDQASLRHLLHAADRARSARVLVIGTENPYRDDSDPVLATELLRHPGFQRLTLGPLGRDGVARLVGEHRGRPVDDRLAAQYTAITGGNPLLLRALLADADPAPGAAGRAPRPTAGGRFHHAVVACLAGAGAAVQQVAGALAVLDARGTPARLGRLLRPDDPTRVDRALALLEAGGLTTGHRLRHPAVAAAATDHLTAAERRRLHERSALLLHAESAPATEVGRHLLAAQPAAPPWAVAVLRDAAAQALVDDDADAAIGYLTAARRACTRPHQAAAVRVALAGATWRVNPSAAEQHCADALADLRAGRLTDGDAALLRRLLTGCGRLEEAGWARPLAADDPRGAAEHATPSPATGWPSVLHPCPWPPAAEEHRPHPAPDAAPAREPWDEALGPGAAAAVWGLPGPGTTEAAVREAESRLRSCPLMDGTLAVVANAVRTLLRAGRTASADQWCQRLLAEAVGRRSPGWQANFLAIRAEIALRRGALADADAYAQEALDRLPGRGGSVLVGSPLACQLLARTVMGRYDDATRVLHHPVPGALFHSVYGLAYLRARGHYHLATGHCRAALGDFRTAGRMAQRWGLDHPALLPWRTDVAQAFLRLGERAKAATMITEELARGRGWSDPHARGVTLRLRARVAAPPERPHLLTRAVEALQECGNRLELAQALADLGTAYQSTGDPVRANKLRRRAWRMAQDCGAAALCDSILPRQAMRGGDRLDLPGRELVAGLSESETRVAILAANGNSNREIALKLCVTMSTVEQHLTRVYRKLNISRRQELPKSLIGPLGTPPGHREDHPAHWEEVSAL
ncbi:AAA family ATPase [Streptomyces sp. B1866]|uniref:AAA family ATPase n=1 Tax=Streptomyces sp. B1866 TaxID=3075431 RepID=UPI00288ECD53|nr:AAA family ATPase [Streptomyces sp. B1866]MDT3397960.1 AAA family ATPase [Streptomyces sp. B1866]